MQNSFFVSMNLQEVGDALVFSISFSGTYWKNDDEGRIVCLESGFNYETKCPDLILPSYD
jgi:hypothetical protein